MPEKKEYGNFKKPGGSSLNRSSSSSSLSKSQKGSPKKKKAPLIKSSSFKEDKDEGKQLSSTLLGMKFMQRMKEAELREKLRKEEEQLVAESQWTRRSLLSSAGVVEEEGIGASEMVGVNGRMSFGNFNPTLESIQNKKEQEKEDAKKVGSNKDLYKDRSNNGLPRGVNIQGVSKGGRDKKRKNS
eukprot:CAMPEP_0201512516 /NCGR_PEP_ID=MMETSP0161_2-20130828/4757_1 /ASSEMBLY_ACC=CAM_ASM_000251 /TAXON_ID=180227 /ORGANISM="Neoparamoeba aestuarina, Strain SoJaBio B1-5/56/2" /LENGTH=184 /DNA_ID=CAMNT_0047908393 /DNA_START=5 /DNA_END=556 /DNA_ORIENTATION=-